MARSLLEPNETWIADWRFGIDEPRERRVSRDLLGVFHSFWRAERIGTKASTTQRRYSAGLHALGGYLVRRSIDPEWAEMTGIDLLDDGLAGGYDGPLIHHENEAWQEDLDTICRKLYRYLHRVGILPGGDDGTLGT